MLLSNLPFLPHALLVVILLLQACGGSPSAVNTNTLSQGSSSERFPFPTVEPETYQGILAVGDGATEETYFVARKGDKWRFDDMREGRPTKSQLRTDKVYVIDHEKRSYHVERPANAADFDTAYFNRLTSNFFRGANYLDYEETERGGGLIKYKAKMYRGSKSEVLVTIDERSGIMVRQEIVDEKAPSDEAGPARFIFEVRDLRLDVDDSVFELPKGYRETARPSQSRSATDNE